MPVSIGVVKKKNHISTAQQIKREPLGLPLSGSLSSVVHLPPSFDVSFWGGSRPIGFHQCPRVSCDLSTGPETLTGLSRGRVGKLRKSLLLCRNGPCLGKGVGEREGGWWKEGRRHGMLCPCLVHLGEGGVASSRRRRRGSATWLEGVEGGGRTLGGTFSGGGSGRKDTPDPQCAASLVPVNLVGCVVQHTWPSREFL